MTMKVLERCMKQIPEHKEGGLHPLHRELILCFQGSIRSERRDQSEINAFTKIQDIVIMDDAKRMQRFYRLPKAKEADETWKRRMDVKTLMNNWTQQNELAEAYFKKHPGYQKPKGPEPLVEPEDWRSRAPGAFQNPTHSSWTLFQKDYPDWAKRIVNGGDLS